MKMNGGKKRIIFLVLALTMLLSCISGCADVQSPDAEQTPESSASQINKVEIDPLAQTAVVKTALAYLARGTNIQYDDSRMTDDSTNVLYRWQSCVRQSPEEYTSQYVGYTNCSAFVGEVYLAALGVNLGTNTTGSLSIISDERRVFSYKPTGKETSEEMASIEEEFRACLIAGDIIVIRYNGKKAGNGHAMMYVGSEILENVDGYKGSAAEGTDENGNPKEEGYVYDIIHSTGSSFKYNEGYEKYEQYGSVQITSTDSLFDSDHARHIFSKVQSVAIIRPLVRFTGEIPQHTLNRMEFMENVIAEKLSSHTAGMTVNPGETMTFTFSITNKNGKPITVPVTDTIPVNTTYVSSENCTVDGTSLSWTVTVPAGQTQTVSYTVRVNEDAKAGDSVCSAEGTVGGIPVKCPKVYIGRTLNKNEQQKLLAAAKENSGNKRGLELVNAVYAKVLGKNDLLPDDYKTLTDGIFSIQKGYSYLAEDGAYQNLVVPGLFGGKFVNQRKSAEEAQLARYEESRTRLLTVDQMIAGDVLLIDIDVQYKNQAMYLYTGEVLLDLISGEMLTAAQTEEILVKCLGDTRFVVLRPSLAMDGGK